MPRKKKEVARKSAHTKNGRINIVVYESIRESEDGSVFYTEVYDTNAELVSGVSTQEYRAASSSYPKEEVISRVIARTIEKFEAKDFKPHEKIDYAAAFATIPKEKYYLLCLPSWGPTVSKSALTFFVRNSISIIQAILDTPIITYEAEKNAQETMLSVVKSHQHERKRLTFTGETESISDEHLNAVVRRLDSAAKESADRHIVETNVIYQASRTLLPEFDLPPIQIPRLILEKYVPQEQCKSLPREFLVGLAAIFELEIEKTSLAVGGYLLLGSMLRPSEACAPKFSNIVDFGTFGVYAVRTKVDSETVEVVDALKSDAAHRTIVIPAFAMWALRTRKKHLVKSGLTEEEINNSYVVSKKNNPFEPASPRDLGFYVKKKMDILGCDDSFWASVSLLMEQEPDIDEHGNILTEPSAYALRRSGCSNLLNCAAAPRLSGEKIPLFVLVDILMGHKLATQDTKWKNWVDRQDNWPLIAQMMETIILDPEHSAHPAFAPGDAMLFPEKVCHSFQRVSVPEKSGQITISIQAHSTDDIFVRFPQKGKTASYTQSVQSKEASTMPVIQEDINREFYTRAINDAIKKHKKEGNDEDSKERKSVYRN